MLTKTTRTIRDSILRDIIPSWTPTEKCNCVYLCVLEKDRGRGQGGGKDGWMEWESICEKKAVTEMRAFYYYFHIIPRPLQIPGTSLQKSNYNFKTGAIKIWNNDYNIF